MLASTYITWDRWSRDVRLPSIVRMILSLNWNEKRDQRMLVSFLCVGKYLSYRAVASQVLSARQSLTSVFGMGTGGPSALNLPTVCELNYVSYAHWKPNKRSILTQHFLRLRTLCSSSPRSISIGQLNTLLYLHPRPIKQIVFLWPYQLTLWDI